MSPKEELKLELVEKVPVELRGLLERRDGAARLLSELPGRYSPDDVGIPGLAQRTWELCGLFYLFSKRFHEGLPLFRALYDHLLAHQMDKGVSGGKGMPLVWMCECHAGLNHPVHAKRYLMLTTCEDAIKERGRISSETGGVYFRLVWKYGLSHDELSRYAMTIWQLCEQNPKEAIFPEWILQELDQEWMTEYPSPQEALFYEVNTRYVRWLLDRLGTGDGKALEQLAHYLLSCMSGCRAHRRMMSKSTDYDVICSLEGLGLDFRSEWGRYLVCECKDWKRPADFTSFAKFCRVLDSVKSRFGILFSKQGITGIDTSTDAAREQQKVFQDRGMIIVVISLADLERVAHGANFVTMLRSKYEEVRLDLRVTTP